MPQVKVKLLQAVSVYFPSARASSERLWVRHATPADRHQRHNDWTGRGFGMAAGHRAPARHAPHETSSAVPAGALASTRTRTLRAVSATSCRLRRSDSTVRRTDAAAASADARAHARTHACTPQGHCWAKGPGRAVAAAGGWAGVRSRGCVCACRRVCRAGGWLGSWQFSWGACSGKCCTEGYRQPSKRCACSRSRTGDNAGGASTSACRGVTAHA